jgi:hypothetical protein
VAKMFAYTYLMDTKGSRSIYVRFATSSEIFRSSYDTTLNVKAVKMAFTALCSRFRMACRTYVVADVVLDYEDILSIVY